MAKLWNSTLNIVSKKRLAEQPRRERWKKAVIGRDNYKCQNPYCKQNTVILDAHHIISKGSRPEWRFVLENGITLCRLCHKMVHDKIICLEIDEDLLKIEFNKGIGTIIE